MTKRKNKIEVNSLVFWNDPAIDDFELKDRRPQLDRVFRVITLSDEMALIREVDTEVGMEIEVMPHELVLVQNKSYRR